MEPKRRILLAHLALTLLAAGAALYYFAAQLATTRIATGPLLTAIALGALACGLGVAAIARIARAAPQELAFLAARYLRIAFSAALIVFMIVLFGTKKEAEARLAAHLFGLMALHRLALLFPARLSSALAAIGRHPLLRGTELAVFNLCATIVLTEGALRAFYVGSGQGFFREETPFKRRLAVPLFGYAPNSLGYNDDEFARAKQPGVRRVAAIGDSFFVAPVPRPQGVIARVETLLAERTAHAEVYNFGILASNIDDYLFVLEKEALSFQPDLVLLGIYVGNDLRISRVQTSFDAHSFAIDRGIADIRRRVTALWLQHTGEFRDVTSEPAAAADLELPVTTRERYLESIRREINYFRDDGKPAVERAWFDSLATLARIIAVCREHNVPLAVVIQPSHPQVSRAIREQGARSAGIDPATLDVSIPQRRFMTFLAERGVPALDLLPAFERAARDRDPDGFYLNNDTHWSVSGNEIAAREIVGFVADQLAALR
jgi:SGNH hydrolase-like domain, acetyltransferase AlgX